MKNGLSKAILVAAVVLPLAITPMSSAQERPDRSEPARTTEGAVPGRTAPTEESTPPTSGEQTTSKPPSVVAPPVNPLPSYYELHKMKSPGFGDIGIAPPVNPMPRATLNENMLTRNTSTPTTSRKPATSRPAPPAPRR